MRRNDEDPRMDGYLDEVMARARLAPADARRVRGELLDHLSTLLELRVARGQTEEEAWAMVSEEFGKPEVLGERISKARGRLLTYLKKKGKRCVVTMLAAVLLVLTVRGYAVGIYKVKSGCVEPYALRGSRVLVNRLQSKYKVNDLVVFRSDGLMFMGIVKGEKPSGELVVGRNNQPDRVVRREALVGRVFLETR